MSEHMFEALRSPKPTSAAMSTYVMGCLLALRAFSTRRWVVGPLITRTVDTRFASNAPGALETDISQRLTDLTLDASGAVYEDLSPRSTIDGTGDGRSVEVLLDLSTGGGTQRVMVHGQNMPAANRYAITFRDNGDLEMRISTGRVLDFTGANAPPNIDGVDRQYLIGWSTGPNPQTTGAPDALWSIGYVYDVTTGDIVHLTATHAADTLSLLSNLTIGGSWTGATMLNIFGGTIYGARISARFHSAVEGREHWLGQTPAPTISGITAVEDSPIPSDACLATSLAGPQYQAAAAAMATGRNRHRMISPVMQWAPPFPAPDLVDDLGDVYGASRVFSMGDGYQSPVAWLVRRRLPKHCAWLLARVQWATKPTDANPPDLVELRVHVSDAAPPFAVQTTTKLISRAVDDLPSFVGVLEYFDPVPIVRDDDGWSWIYFSARTNGGVAPSNVEYSIREFTATPMAAGIGFDDAPPDEWSP
jgi:hypothetical protein